MSKKEDSDVQKAVKNMDRQLKLLGITCAFVFIKGHDDGKGVTHGVHFDAPRLDPVFASEMAASAAMLSGQIFRTVRGENVVGK